MSQVRESYRPCLFVSCGCREQTLLFTSVVINLHSSRWCYWTAYSNIKHWNCFLFFCFLSLTIYGASIALFIDTWQKMRERDDIFEFAVDILTANLWGRSLVGMSCSWECLYALNVGLQLLLLHITLISLDYSLHIYLLLCYVLSSKFAMKFSPRPVNFLLYIQLH